MKKIWAILSSEDVQHGVVAGMVMIALAYFLIWVLGITPEVIP